MRNLCYGMRWIIGLVFLLAWQALGQGLLLVKPEPMDPKQLLGQWEGEGPGGPCTVTIAAKTLRYSQSASGPDGEAMWFDTQYKVLPKIEPQRLYATITKNSYPDQPHIGKVIVVLFTFFDGTLKLGVIDSLDEAPVEPAEATWDDVMDEYRLKRAQTQQ